MSGLEEGARAPEQPVDAAAAAEALAGVAGAGGLAAESPPAVSANGTANREGALALSRKEVLERIERDTRFVIVTHENPDGDALGSLIAMHGLLRELGKEVETFLAESDLPLPPEYRDFEIADAVHTVPADIGERTVIFLDCGNLDRTPGVGLAGGAHVINIDHHHDNTCFGTINHVVADASCTAEIIWDLMRALGVQPRGEVADALYVAVVTDTGRFMYESTGPRAHLMAAELIAAGVDVQAAYRRLYEDAPLAKLVLLGTALRAVRRFDEGRLTLTVLSAEDFIEAGAEQSYSEGVVDHLRSVQGTKVAALVRELTERRGEHKISLRATGDEVDVSVIARARGGGGHRRAAGFSTTHGVDEVISFLREQIGAQIGGGSEGPSSGQP
jgi:phosphoesterase RecJ-like protein